jgi:hypothetical protein
MGFYKMVKYTVKTRCFHLAFRCLKNNKISLDLTYVMLHIISFQNMSKKFAQVSFIILKTEFFQTHITWGSYMCRFSRLTTFGTFRLSFKAVYSISNQNTRPRINRFKLFRH